MITAIVKTNRGDNVDNVVEAIQTEVISVCSRIPPDLPEEDACEWLRHALLDVVYNNT